jgi:hypothetical protein
LVREIPSEWKIWLAKKLAEQVARFVEKSHPIQHTSRNYLIAERILSHMKSVVGKPPARSEQEVDEIMKAIAGGLATWIDKILGDEKEFMLWKETCRTGI